jgi:enoyl-CoA hydratase/isomerase-like protein
MSVGLEIDEGGVARVTLRRPEAGNTIDLETARGLREAARACAREHVRAVLLPGEGRSFCVGGDLRDFAALTGDALEKHLIAVTGALHDALRAFAALDAPPIPAARVSRPSSTRGCRSSRVSHPVPDRRPPWRSPCRKHSSSAPSAGRHVHAVRG